MRAHLFHLVKIDFVAFLVYVEVPDAIYLSSYTMSRLIALDGRSQKCSNRKRYNMFCLHFFFLKMNY